MNTVEIVCAYCHTTTKKAKKEIERQKRNGKNNFYCSRVCAGWGVSRYNLKLVKNRHSKGGGRKSNPFNYYLHMCRVRAIERPKENTLTLAELQEVWNIQHGRCAYTGIEMVHPYLKANRQDKKLLIASLDRIDSSKGYVKDNVQFILRPLNYGKNVMTDREFRDFLELLGLKRIDCGDTDRTSSAILEQVHHFDTNEKD